MEADSKKWIVPANPKYFDLDAAFRESKIIIWKQSSRIAVGDTVYMYVAAPYSAIRFRCRAVEVDIPYTARGDVNIDRVMRIELLQRYDGIRLGLDLLRAHDVYTVRGPRKMPESLADFIAELYP